MDTLTIFEEYPFANEGFYSEPGLNDSKTKATLKKISKIVSGFAEGLIKMVLKLINTFKNVFSNANKQLNAVKSIASVVDTYDYMSISQNASAVISAYYDYIVKVREIDHEINKSVNLVDTMKGSLKENTFGSRNKASKRDLLEDVIFYFGKMDGCNESLNALLESANKEIPVPHPKRYSLDFIKKEMNATFNGKIKMLQNLKTQLDITKKMYDDRNFMYRNMHSEDIRRNQNMLNHTALLIRYTEDFRALYVKLLAQIDGVNVATGEDTEEESMFED